MATIIPIPDLTTWTDDQLLDLLDALLAEKRRRQHDRAVVGNALHAYHSHAANRTACGALVVDGQPATTSQPQDVTCHVCRMARQREIAAARDSDRRQREMAPRRQPIPVHALADRDHTRCGLDAIVVGGPVTTTDPGSVTCEACL